MCNSETEGSRVTFVLRRESDFHIPWVCTPQKCVLNAQVYTACVVVSRCVGICITHDAHTNSCVYTQNTHKCMQLHTHSHPISHVHTHTCSLSSPHHRDAMLLSNSG
jgi:hypothetical protein